MRGRQRKDGRADPEAAVRDWPSAEERELGEAARPRAMLDKAQREGEQACWEQACWEQAGWEPLPVWPKAGGKRGWTGAGSSSPTALPADLSLPSTEGTLLWSVIPDNEGNQLKTV